MTTRSTLAISGISALLLTAALGGCAGTEFSSTLPGFGAPETRATDSAAAEASAHYLTIADTGIDVGVFGENLAAAVAEQNTDAYGVESRVIDTPAGDETADLSSTAPDYLAAEEAADAADGFDEVLDSGAASDFTEQEQNLDLTEAAIAADDIEVDRVVVAVDDISSEGVSATEVEVSVDLYVARELNTGVVWEEVIAHVATVDASGEIVAYEVQDDFWYAQEGVYNPADETEPGNLSPEELSGEDTEEDLTSAEIESSGEASTALYGKEDLAVQTVLNSTQRAKVVAYANKYWNNYNPAYIPSEQDCTNFISQALFAGGWTKVTGLYNTDGAWWYTGNALLPKSYAWATAQNFYNFAVKESKRSKVHASVYDLLPGQVLQYDVTATGMNHTMVVTKVVDGAPYLTYHTSDNHNKPFSAVAVAVRVHDTTPRWFPLSV